MDEGQGDTEGGGIGGHGEETEKVNERETDRGAGEDVGCVDRQYQQDQCVVSSLVVFAKEKTMATQLWLMLWIVMLINHQ